MGRVGWAGTQLGRTLATEQGISNTHPNTHPPAPLPPTTLLIFSWQMYDSVKEKAGMGPSDVKEELKQGGWVGACVVGCGCSGGTCNGWAPPVEVRMLGWGSERHMPQRSAL